MRKSRLLELELDYELENKNFIFNYENEGVVLSRCTCGFTSTKIQGHGSCPKCNTSMSARLYNEDITEENDFLSEYHFDKLKGSVKIVRLSCYYGSKEKDIIIDKNEIEFVFKYELNRLKNYKYKPEIIIDGESTRFLKSEVEKYRFGSTEFSVKDKLSGFVGVETNGYSCLHETIWSIHNKYKHCFDALQLDIYEGYEYSLDSLKAWNSFLKTLNEKDLKYLKLYAKSNNTRGRRLYIYDVRRFFNQYGDNKEKVYRHIDILTDLKSKREFRGDADGLPYSWRNPEEVADFMVESTFTFDEIKELLALAERQAYNMAGNNYNMKRVYGTLNRIGLPIDKKPRELAIYMNKMQKLIDMNNNRNICLIKYDEDMEPIRGEHREEIIKRIYDNFGYKGLDKILFYCYMKKKMSPLFLSYPIDKDKRHSTEDIAFFSCEGKNVRYSYKEEIVAILTEDNRLLTEEEEVQTYITEKYEKYNKELIKAALETA